MNKVLTAILTAAGSALGAAAVPLYFRWRTRRNAEATRPKIEALLDEMIRLVSAHKGRLSDVVFDNSLKTHNDERRERDISVRAGGSFYALDVSTRLTGRKRDRVSVRLYRSRDEAVLHLFWPEIGEYWPMEPWLKDRLDRLDALVGDVSRRGRIGKILSRFGGKKDDDDGPPNTN